MRKIKITYYLIIALLPLLTSCGSTSKFLGLYDGYGVEELSKSYIENKNNLLLNALSEQMKEVTVNNTTTQAPFLPKYCINYSTLSTNENAECSALRTIIVGDLMAMSNQICEEHKRSIWGNEASFNMVTSTLTNIFSGAATVVTGGTGQAALAALALFSNAERSLGNETVYKNMLIHAIVQKITDKRTELTNTLRSKITTNARSDYYSYPINIALLDVTDYHNSCSFMSGLELAIKEGTNDKKPQQIAKLENQIALLSTQIDARALYLKNNNISRQPEDYHLADLNRRYNSASTKLAALEAQTAGTHIPPATVPTVPTVPTPTATAPNNLAGIRNPITTTEKQLSLADGKKIQLALCVNADGDFGLKTRTAIKYYQSASSLTNSGKLEKQESANLLIKAKSCINLPNNYLNAFERFKYETSTLIEGLQQQIKVAITGKFNEVTRKAIKNIQKQNNKPETGQVTSEFLDLIAE